MAVTRRKARRFIVVFMSSSYSALARAVCGGPRRRGGGLVNGFANPEIRAATADVAVHRAIDVGVGRPGRRGQQRRSRHDLAGLAVAALRHVDLLPRNLQRMRPVRGEPFECRDRRVRRGRHRRLAGANRAAAHVHGARAALSDAATELRALQIQHIANDPQQGHVGGHIDRGRFSVDVQGVRHRVTRYRTGTYGPGGARGIRPKRVANCKGAGRPRPP